MNPRIILSLLFILSLSPLSQEALHSQDHLRRLQANAIESGSASWGHWGAAPAKFSSWTSHSNRLTPIYTFGGNLDRVDGENSPYRTEAAVAALYDRRPERTVNPKAAYFDQTDVYKLQQHAAAAGKRNIILMVFDGMDWQTTQAAAIYRSGTEYEKGRGSGLAFQDYRGAETDYGFFVTSPYSGDPKVDVNAQLITALPPKIGGYDAFLGGAAAWDKPAVMTYLIGKSRARPHEVTDSAASATSMTAGIKTYNAAVNVDADGGHVTPVARSLQQQGWTIGVVTSVPISHATPACAYANNVSRADYQDLTRDLLGRPSIAHRAEPLSGVDVLIGCGWGVTKATDSGQGQNYVPGNRYLTDADLQAIDQGNGGKYVTALRMPGRSGNQVLKAAARQAAEEEKRLFGFFGVAKGHLPYRTADGDYDPPPGVNGAERYTKQDIDENPTLAEMTASALHVVSAAKGPFWLLVEAGDVDWANHDNNIDNSIGAVISGDEAFQEVVKWVDKEKAWEDTVVIVTADHGHYFHLLQADALIPTDRTANGATAE